MVFCDEPYIGEESIIRPPASKKARMTSAHASRATGSLPTLKVIQLPSPTAGIASPDDGIARVRIAPGCAAAGGTAASAPAAARECMTVRRLSLSTGGMAPLRLRRTVGKMGAVRPSFHPAG